MVLMLDETAVVVRDDGVLRVGGPDRLTYLHSLLSQDFEHATAGDVADFLYLDAKGNALAAGRAVVRAEDVLVVAPAEVAASLAGALQRFTFLLQAETTDCSGEWAVASVRGPAPVEMTGARREPMRAAPAGAGVIVRDRSGGVDLVGPASWVQERVAALGLPEGKAGDFEAWRLSAGEPRWGSEIAAGHRAQELGLLPTHVHLRKGCYPGQESIAKIYNLGRPRRALAVLEMSGPVAPGDPLTVDGRAGQITSAAAVGQTWVALGFVPVGPDGAVLGDGTVAAGDVRGRVRRRVGEGLEIPGA